MARLAILFAAAAIGLSPLTLIAAEDRGDTSSESKPHAINTQASAETDRDKLVEQITGSVQGPDGKPAAGARVVVIGTPWQGDNSVWLFGYPIEVIAETTCDQTGAFRLDQFKPTTGRWQLARLFVVADGCGLVWRRVDLYQPQANPIARCTADRPRTSRPRDDG